MRAMSFVALVAAIGFGAVTLTYSGSGPNGIYITFGSGYRTASEIGPDSDSEGNLIGQTPL